MSKQCRPRCKASLVQYIMGGGGEYIMGGGVILNFIINKVYTDKIKITQFMILVPQSLVLGHERSWGRRHHTFTHDRPSIYTHLYRRCLRTQRNPQHEHFWSGRLRTKGAIEPLSNFRSDTRVGSREQPEGPPTSRATTQKRHLTYIGSNIHFSIQCKTYNSHLHKS